MEYNKCPINYVYYYIEKGLINKENISNWADRVILRRKNIPYYVIELSLAKSLDEQFFVLYDNFPEGYLKFKNLSGIRIIHRVRSQYNSNKIDILDSINIIFHMKDDIDLDNNLLHDIYLLDDEKDKYLENKISMKDLKTYLNIFFRKY